MHVSGWVRGGPVSRIALAVVIRGAPPFSDVCGLV